MLAKKLFLLPIILFALPLGSCDFLEALMKPQDENQDVDESKDSEHTHTFSTTWSKDEVAHWHQATCEHSSLTSDYEEHSYDDQGVCVCGAIKPIDPVPQDPVIKVNGQEVALTHPAYFIDEVVMCDVVEISSFLGVNAEYSGDGKICSATKGNLMVFVEKEKSEFVVTDVSSMSTINHTLKKPTVKTDYGIDISVDDYADAFGFTSTLTNNVLSITSK